MTTPQRIIKELHIMGAISEQTALNAKEVAELADTKQAHARLCELRDQGLVIASSRTGKNKYWLTLAGVQAAEKLEESKHDQANNAIENNVLSDVDGTNVADSQAIPKGFTHWAGGTCPVGLNEWVSVVLRIGTIKQRALAGALFWGNPGSDFDIIAYRLVFDISADNVYTAENSDQLDEKLDIPPPQYDPKDVAFKNSDITESWYMVDGINTQFETSSDAISAAHDYVATHTMSTTVHVVASRKFAIIKPVITTELEYL